MCGEQKVVLRSPEGKRVSYRGVQSKPVATLVSMLKMRKYVEKGHDVFLCHVQDLSAVVEDV